MKVLVRDGLWAMTLLAAGLAWIDGRHRHQVVVRELEAQLAEAEHDLGRATGQIESLLARNVLQEEQLVELRDAIKGSLGDRRDWFRLQVSRNALVAVEPASSDTHRPTLRTIETIEQATGLDGKRMKHFMTPIRALELLGD